MAHSGSRRDLSAVSRRFTLAALALSICIFLGGSGSLAFALHARAHPAPVDTHARERPQHTISTIRGYDPTEIVNSSGRKPLTEDGADQGVLKGLIDPDEEAAKERVKREKQQAEAKKKKAAEEEKARQVAGKANASKETPEKQKDRQAEKRVELGGEVTAAQDEPAEDPPPQDAAVEHVTHTETIHHTAYKRTPVYRTVHHQASTATEVPSGNGTKLVWSSCPVCGARHDSAYNERVVDHYIETLCTACGAKHVAAYDEVIEY